MENQKPSSKMFLDIVGELRVLIKEEGIKTGGKLPSERELAERLQAGRSTIREALRSLRVTRTYRNKPRRRNISC